MENYSKNQLAKELSMPMNIIYNYCKEFEELYPAKIGSLPFRNGKGYYNTYSPEIIDFIKDKINKDNTNTKELPKELNNINNNTELNNNSNITKETNTKEPSIDSLNLGYLSKTEEDTNIAMKIYSVLSLLNKDTDTKINDLSDYMKNINIDTINNKLDNLNDNIKSINLPDINLNPMLTKIDYLQSNINTLIEKLNNMENNIKQYIDNALNSKINSVLNDIIVLLKQKDKVNMDPKIMNMLEDIQKNAYLASHWKFLGLF